MWSPLASVVLVIMVSSMIPPCSLVITDSVPCRPRPRRSVAAAPCHRASEHALRARSAAHRVHGEALNVGDRHALEERDRVLAAPADRAHVRHVEETRLAAHLPQTGALSLGWTVAATAPGMVRGAWAGRARCGLPRPQDPGKCILVASVRRCLPQGGPGLACTLIRTCFTESMMDCA